MGRSSGKRRARCGWSVTSSAAERTLTQTAPVSPKEPHRRSKESSATIAAVKAATKH